MTGQKNSYTPTKLLLHYSVTLTCLIIDPLLKIIYYPYNDATHHVETKVEPCNSNIISAERILKLQC